ncbi:hypothetical protein JXA48_01750 [Candidatus Woesearchaeota archaeon]|nr:hypothetical protein [Candidatus Woesearchaeota archaeon]
MEINSNTSFQIEQDLLNCGLSQESISSIRDTAVITRNGSQHVVPGSQSHLDESRRNITTQIESATENSNFALRLAEQQQMFSRYKQFSENRIATLERNLSSTMEALKELHSAVATIKSNQQAQNRVASSSQQGVTEKTPSQQAIDRNNTAPIDVQVEKIFYCGE